MFLSHRSMYWTDWSSSPKIEKAFMDGTSRRVLFDTGLGWPNGLTQDYAVSHYIGLMHKLITWKGQVQVAQTTNKYHAVSNHFIHPFGQTFHCGYLCWTDWVWNAVFFSC